MSKLLGLDYKIIYRKRIENKIADALSRQPSGTTAASFVLQSSITPKWMTFVSQSYEGDEKAVELIKQLSIDASAQPGFHFQNGLLYCLNKLYVGLSYWPERSATSLASWISYRWAFRHKWYSHMVEETLLLAWDAY